MSESHTDNIIDEERKAIGLSKRDKNDISSFIQGDDQLFKTWIATPREPIQSERRLVGTEKVLMGQDKDGNDIFKDKDIFQTFTFPAMVPTMALGNLSTREVQLMRLYLEMARRTQRHGYMNVAINLYYKAVFLCVSSQSHMAFLARQLFTENVNVMRKEESFGESRDTTTQPKSTMDNIMSKIKGADGTTMWGKGGMKGTGVQDSGAYGMRSS